MKTIHLQVAIALDDVAVGTVRGILVEAFKRSMMASAKSRILDDILQGRRAGVKSDDGPAAGQHDELDAIQPLTLRPRDAAKALRISPRLLWQLSKDGQIPCVKVGCGKRQMSLSSVAAHKAWLEHQTAMGIE